MKADDPGPIPDAGTRRQSSEADPPMIDAGIDNLQKALTISPEYSDAMST